MLDVHIVLHTHWDREWYHPAERFRQRLVALVDALLDDPPTDQDGFLLDGQAIVVEDYVDVRPDRAEELRSLLADGRVEAGPWYVLADELIPSGEAIVRNLLTGRRVLARFGTTSPPVLYCPDSFGHPAALPSVATGFGLPLVILWRGFGGRRWPAGDVVRWSAPNGEQVFLFHLPRDGYEFGSELPADAQGAEARWQRMRDELVPRSSTGVILVPSGADHHARQRDWRAALAAMETAGAADGVHRSSLRRFADRLLERARAERPPVVGGELRDSYGYAWTLQGTFATRAYEKRLNAGAEQLLLREAEPWSALAGRAGVSRRPLVNEAWRTLLRAHPHDTLCGCSIDEVADAMELRLRSAVQQGEGIREDSVLDLIGHDPVAAREAGARSRWRPIVLVRNPAARQRGGVAILEIEEFLADVAVGPGSASASRGEVTAPDTTPVIAALGPMQVLSRGLRYSRTESPQHYPDNDLVSVTRVAAWVPGVPAYGIAGYEIGEVDPERNGRKPRRLSHARDPVIVRGRMMRNATLSVVVDEDGMVTLEHLESGRRIVSLLEIVDEADGGDLYTPSPRPRSCSIVFRGVRRVHRGPLRGELSLRFRVTSGETTGRAHPDVDLDVRLMLDAGSPLLAIELHGENRRDDHRLRLNVRSDLVGGTVWADAAFGPVRREPIVVSEAEAEIEIPPRTSPLHRYVSRFTEAAGVTLISDGLAEYEAREDGSMLVTLVRSVGSLSRTGIPERPGHAGWPVPTPGAQCIGPFAAKLAVYMHGPRLAGTIDAIERAADDVLLPLTGTTLRSALTVPPRVRGVELSGVGLAFSTLKESEDGQWLVLRCVNLREEEVAGHWTVPFEIAEAKQARLDETVTGDLTWMGSEVEFVAPSRGIVTLLVR